MATAAEEAKESAEEERVNAESTHSPHLRLREALRAGLSPHPIATRRKKALDAGCSTRLIVVAKLLTLH